MFPRALCVAPPCLLTQPVSAAPGLWLWVTLATAVGVGVSAHLSVSACALRACTLGCVHVQVACVSHVCACAGVSRQVRRQP